MYQIKYGRRQAKFANAILYRTARNGRSETAKPSCAPKKDNLQKAQNITGM